MSRNYFIHDALGQRRVDEIELPLRIGGKSHAGIVLPDAPEEQLAAYIALSDGHVYLQPAGDAPLVFLNDERISDSAWLKSGDRIQIDDSLLSWTVRGDKVLIDVVLQTADHGLRPPLQPPPRTAPSVNNDMPVRSSDRISTREPKRTRRFIYALTSLLLLTTLYLVLATPVVILIEPEPQQLKMKGFPPPLPLWGSHLSLPGHYTIEAYRQGYAQLSEEVDISMGGTSRLNFSFSELPGLLQITTQPDVKQKLSVDGFEPSFDQSGAAQLSRGAHALRIETERYLAHEQQIDVAGLGETQQLDIKLLPAWAEVSMSSQPDAASVLVDGKLIGLTPLTTEIMQGPHEIQLKLAGFKTATIQQQIYPGKVLTLPQFQLQPLDGTLSVLSQPGAASITVDGIFQGTTPMQLELAANIEHRLRLSKSGYHVVEQQIRLRPGEEKKLEISMKAEYGTVFLSTFPADAVLLIDGKTADRQSGRLRLSVRTHTLTLSKPGYVSQTLSVTPKAGVSQNIDVKLQTLQQQNIQKKVAATPPLINSPDGQSLQLITPDSKLVMGASRREAGRRANESRRLIQLSRPFYFAHKETSNHQYRKFMVAHDSGSLDGAALNGEDQPVVNVSWDDAARYGNWLSQQQGLPAAYIEKDGKMRAVQPMNSGYRLPTEAEWAWVARRHGQSGSQRYPWAGTYPPATPEGNYADARISDTLADIVPGYDDSYRGTAAVASYPDRPPGFYDLGGNVSEWSHDYYALYPGEADKLVTDPAGPISGDHHVVRGASWRHGNITELRLSYRDYSNKPRYDLGFRIARYAE